MPLECPLIWLGGNGALAGAPAALGAARQLHN
jgi:hypothetical protein